MNCQIITNENKAVKWEFEVNGENFKATVLFTGRDGGFSTGSYASLNLSPYVGDSLHSVTNNRETLALVFGLSDFYTLDQIHSSKVIKLDQKFIKTLPLGHLNLKGDALITNSWLTPIAVLTADCLPVIAVAEPGIAGAIHCGWRGLLNGVLENAVIEMKKMGAFNFAFFFGPSICQNCYQVGFEVAREFLGKFKSGVKTIAGKYYLCLKSIGFEILRNLDVVDLMVEVGSKKGVAVADGKVFNLPDCTFENYCYYSYRREKNTGRQAGLVILNGR